MEENIKAWNTIKTWNTRACKELRWIPVEEALPEADGYGLSETVLVWYEYWRYGDYDCPWQTYGLGKYLELDKYWSVEGANPTRVLAWTPLPEAYEEAKQKDVSE